MEHQRQAPPFSRIYKDLSAVFERALRRLVR